MLAQIQQIRHTEPVSQYLDVFAKEYSLNSQATATAYKLDIERFLKFASPMGVNVPVARMTDLISYETLTKFRHHEIKRNLKPQSINRSITALREFSKHLMSQRALREEGLDIDTGAFSSIKNLKGDADSYEVISIKEGIQIAEWLRDNEKRNGVEKYYYTLLALDTGVRAEALSNLTPSSFSVRDDIVVIKGVDKGKKSFTKNMSHSLYEEIKERLDWSQPSQPLFNITAKNRTDMMKRALKGLNWEHRNIVFHSFKKAAVNNAYEITGDIMIAKRVASHSSVATTQAYLEEGEDFLGAISSRARDVSDIDLNGFSKDELIQAIGKMSQNSQYQLKTLLMELE